MSKSSPQRKRFRARIYLTFESRRDLALYEAIKVSAKKDNRAIVLQTKQLCAEALRARYPVSLHPNDHN